MADALASLLGAVIGGSLVLLGDGVRRRSERREADRRRLFDTAVALAAAYNRIGGELMDAHERGLPRSDALLPGGERYELQTRFWASPGCGALSREASQLSMSWTALYDSYDNMAAWSQVAGAHIRALREFEAAIRREMGDPAALPESRASNPSPGSSGA